MKYYIIAGEASGDLHGSNLMKGLYAEDPDARIRFWGGGMMEAAAREAQGNAQAGVALAGAEAQDTVLPVCDYRDGAVMGLADVLAKAGKLLGNLSMCKKDILEWKPDVVVLIDYPGFNMKIAKFAHRNGIKVYYYIAPKTWASREGRNRRLRKYVDRLFIVFPFEIPYFESRGIPFTYRGNPLVDAVDMSPAMTEPREEFFARNNLHETPFIAILAGSRKGEIARTMPVAMAVADKLHSLPRFSNWQFIIAGAPGRTPADYEPFIGNRTYVKLVSGETYSVLRHSEAAIINSGTASLEAALIGTPQVVVWSTGTVTALIAKYILRVLDHIKYISLGNLIVDRPVFRELIQFDMTADNVAAELLRLITDEPYRAEMLKGYAEIRAALGGTGASRSVARAMVDDMHSSPESL